MRVPVIFLGKGLVDAVVKVLIVREDDMATNIIELEVVSFGEQRKRGVK